MQFQLKHGLNLLSQNSNVDNYQLMKTHFTESKIYVIG